MLPYILSLLKTQSITLCGCIPLSSCRIQKPYLLKKTGIATGSVVIFAIPYYTPICDGNRNLSAYAVAKDYHLFVKNLEITLTKQLKQQCPDQTFAFFADHSPIEEREAAAKAGLGMIGKNGLLITEPYSSYVFLGELITDAVLPYREYPVAFCEMCGACTAACPMKKGECQICLSALTQKKGNLSTEEKALICKFGTAWGCDICSEICPHTISAKKAGTVYSPIPFFHQDALPILTPETLDSMTENIFKERAYSWRGREIIRRNLAALEEINEPGKHNSQKTTPPREAKK